MRLNRLPRLTLAFLFVCAAYPVLAQTIPAATESRLPLAIGIGLSAYNPDIGQGHLLGGTLWVDYFPNNVPQLLHGFGLEVEARDLSLNRSSSQPANLREDTVEGGVIYSWQHFRNFRPYGKFLMGYGNADHLPYAGAIYGHDSRTITIAGGGVDVRVFQRVWARADYEYQSWPDFLKHAAPISSGNLTPQGFTVGALYRFGGRHSH